MVALDDSVTNLQNFNALLAKTCPQLGEQNSTLESEGNELEQLTSDAEGKIGGFNDDLEEALQELQEAGSDAEAAVDGVTDAATEITQSRLARAEDDLEEAQGDFEENRDRGESQIEEGFSRLTEAGFQAYGTTVDEVEGELQRVRDSSQENFDTLDGALEEFQGRVDGTRSETNAAMEEAQGDIESDGGELEGDFKDVTSQWDASIDGVLKSGCEEAGTTLEQEYADWEEAAGSVADALAQAISDAVSGAAEFLGQDTYQAQEDALRETMNGPGEALLTEAGTSVGSLETGQAVTGVLDPLVGELEIVLRVVDQIDELLKAMG